MVKKYGRKLPLSHQVSSQIDAFFFIAIQAQESLGKPLRNSLYILGFNILTILYS